jgi:phosphoribosylanthranilate isomerase
MTEVPPAFRPWPAPDASATAAPPATGETAAPRLPPPIPARRVAVKICGVTEPDGAALAAALGADFLGLNFWPGSPRHLDPARAREVAAAARAAAPGVLLVGVFVHPTLAEIEAATAAAGLDLVQLSGDETAASVRALPCRIIKALRLSAAAAAASLPPDSAARPKSWAAAVAGFEECWGLLFDTPRGLQPPGGSPGPPAAAGGAGRDRGGNGGTAAAADYGGTGRAWNHAALAPLLAALPGRRVFVAGGLTPANVRQVVAGLQPFAIDVCSGVESAPGRKDPRLLRRLFEEIG